MLLDSGLKRISGISFRFQSLKRTHNRFLEKRNSSELALRLPNLSRDFPGEATSEKGWKALI
jgi:hypothetical protein